MRSFVYDGDMARVVFGRGTLAGLADEVDRLGGTRAIVLTGADLAEPADRAARALGPRLAARFDDATMHTPVDVTERALGVAREAGVDCLISLGGGSATGLGKALAGRTALPLIAVPSTYAGSEATPIVGETAGAEKTTRTDPAVRPRTIVYDVDLTLSLPVELTVTSAVNALAHAVEALYAPQANPVTDQLAERAIGLFAAALPRLVDEPSNVDARADALAGAWLAGTCLGTVGMGLHHKLCHLLGGTFGLPHSPTHTVVLPYAMAYNAPAAPDAMSTVARALGRSGDAPAAMFDLITSVGGPTSLSTLGFASGDVDRAAELATTAPYPNPRPVTLAGVAELLRLALAGQRPAGRPDVGWLTAEVVRSFDGAPDRLRQLLGSLVEHLHEFAYDQDVTQAEWAQAIDFLTRTGQISNAKRQEFVLLSDTLGVSSMVDLLTNSRTPDTTPSAVLGPFYVDSAPPAPAGGDISGGQAGTPLWTDVVVTAPSGAPVSGASVDVWQSNEDGFYDLQLSEGPLLRARFTSDAEGRVRFWSILPSEYPIPADGPVGQLLAATGRHPYRAPHLHFLITAPGYRQLITQLFVAGGAYLDSDTVFGVKDALIVDFAPGVGAPPPGRSVDGEWRHLTYTFRIAAVT